MMTKHLDDRQLSAALASAALDHNARDHLGSCLACRRRLEIFRDTVAARRRGMMATAPDFEEQKQSILTRVALPAAAPAGLRKRWVRSLLAAAATALLVAGAGLLYHHTSQTTLNLPRPDLPIEDILAETEALLADDSIPGFDILDEYSEAEIDSTLDNQSSGI